MVLKNLSLSALILSGICIIVWLGAYKVEKEYGSMVAKVQMVGEYLDKCNAMLDSINNLQVSLNEQRQKLEAEINKAVESVPDWAACHSNGSSLLRPTPKKGHSLSPSSPSAR